MDIFARMGENSIAFAWLVACYISDPSVFD